MAAQSTDIHRIAPGSAVDLSRIPTSAETFHDDEDDARAAFKAMRREFVELQRKLYAEGRRKLLIVLQAMDAGGKDGTIKGILKGVNPQGVRVESFKAPTSHELAHDYLWRIHKVAPRTGMITVFNRSHYEDVLVVRVENIVPEADWRLRYTHINSFEKLLAETGTTILKFYLHISREEQKRRFHSRIATPRKQWKFSAHDLVKAHDWDAYAAAYEDAIGLCSTEHAPWYVIPADDKWYRNFAIMRAVTETLRGMDPQFPALDYDPAAVEL